MKKNYISTHAVIVGSVILGLMILPVNLFAQKGYVAGDFHQHTTYTDGSWSFEYMMKKNVEFGLDWWANSEHGGGFTRYGSVSGIDKDTTIYWDEQVPNPVIGDVAMSGGHQVMWRWQSLMDYSFQNILQARRAFPSKLIIQGYEMNVPGHEHGSVGIIAGEFGRYPNASALAEFEYKFDGSDADVTGGASMGWVKSNLSGHDRTLDAIRWLQTKYKGESWLVPAHPERKQKYTVADFRDMNNAGPDVCFGFESMPGHQKGPQRGGYSTSADGGGTYGGCGVYAAKVGGLWDAMLSEGRHFWLFASSDFHDVSEDFYPGEYQKTYTYVKHRKNPYALVDGLHSGNTWIVEGDLIDMLSFKAYGMGDATMGENLKFNKKIKISIILRDPNTNNNHDINPVLDHVDLIMGKVTGKIDPSDPEYSNPEASETKVIARFDATGGIVDADGLESTKWHKSRNGIIYINYMVDADDACYFRLRGTNNGLNTAGETDASGNPFIDVVGENTEEKSWNDLWFYSNPIFATPYFHKSNHHSDCHQFKSTSDATQTENLETPEITGEVSIYPNPASSVIYFDNIKENTYIEMYNATGKLVLSAVLTNRSVDISQLPNGVYIVKVKNNDKVSTLKVLKK